MSIGISSQEETARQQTTSQVKGTKQHSKQHLKSRGGSNTANHTSSQEEEATQQTTSQVKGSKPHSTPVDKACQSSEDEQVSEDDGFNTWALYLNSNLLTCLPQHSLVDLSQGCCSNGPF